VITGESSRDAFSFMDRVLDRMEELASNMASMKTENFEI